MKKKIFIDLSTSNMADNNGPPAKKQRNSVLSLPDRIFDGYQYHNGKKLAGGARRLHCSKKYSYACNAMGTISALDVFTYEPERSEHNHEPDVNSECKSRFIRDLYVACRHEFRDLQIIYSDTSIM
ncbi:uncharacterized protein LOC141532040 [Cotesia typhae]|uniref:uncharacterized protein LOC141532040 n=1 Tax=Cotesia typhae TaxID=2053667 RepID=UPI003D681687